MELISDQSSIGKDQKTCFQFLSLPENYKILMPENTEKFAVNNLGGFNFRLKGMPEISLKKGEVKPERGELSWDSGSEKFKFTLSVKIEKISDRESQVQFLFHGDLNPMVAMMAKNPLNKFIHTLQANLKKV